MQKKTVLRIVILALIVVWMTTIFKFSNQNGETSSNLSRNVASIFVSDEAKVDILEPYIRKIAHLSEYACGGVLFLSLFLTYALSDAKRMLFSLLIGIEYAALDEVHQLFIAGRAGKLIDVLIDTIGVALGICVWMLIFKLTMKQWKKRKDGVSHQ